MEPHPTVNARCAAFTPRQSCYGTQMSRLPLNIALCAASLILGGCAADTANYPSLARRAAERIGDTPAATQAAEVPPPAPSPEMLAQLADLVTQARSAHRQFLAHRPQAERLTAAASRAAIASESWAVASVALADLESSRSNAMIALARLDEIYAAARVDGGNVGAIAEARGQVITLVGEEDRVLANLRGRIAG